MIAALAMADGVAVLGFFALLALVVIAMIAASTIVDVAGTRSRERIRRWEIDHEVWMQKKDEKEGTP